MPSQNRRAGILQPLQDSALRPWSTVPAYQVRDHGHRDDQRGAHEQRTEESKGSSTQVRESRAAINEVHRLQNLQVPSRC